MHNEYSNHRLYSSKVSQSGNANNHHQFFHSKILLAKHLFKRAETLELTYQHYLNYYIHTMADVSQTSEALNEINKMGHC